tara:strand:- start:9531 stop:18770 length:9240 start_codon:yes stop_codon:yes gene_type:complete
MNSDDSIFLNLYYKQLFSTVTSSLTRYHFDHDSCFDSILNTADSALIIHAQHSHHPAIISLPLLESLTVLKSDTKKPYNFNTFQSQLKTFFSSSQASLNLFESFYFHSSFIKKVSKSPFQSYQRFAKSQPPADIKPFLKTILHTLDDLINHYDTTIFWTSLDHKRYFQRIHDKATLLQKSSTASLLDSFFSLVPTLISQTKLSSELIYNAKTNNPDLFPADFQAWNKHLSQLLILFRAIFQAFLAFSFYKLHYFTILNTSPNLHTKDSQSDYLVSLIKDVQTKLAHNLCFQNGFLADMLSGLQDILAAHSAYSSDISSFATDIKQSYFDVKHNSIDYLSSLRQLSTQSWVHYFNTCFTNQLSYLSLSLIKQFYDLLPVSEFSEILSEHFVSYAKSLESLTHSLPKSIQNQTNNSLKVSESLYTALYADTERLYYLIFWSSIVSLYLSTQGRYSLLSECSILVHQKLPNSLLSATFLTYFSVSLTPNMFKLYIDYLTQLYPQNMLTIINSSISLYPDTNTISLQHDASFANWYNSSQFVNRWIASFRFNIFTSSPDTWKCLYPYMSYFFISTSHLLKEWIDYAPAHPLERQCLIRMIHYISHQSPQDIRLYNLFVRTQHLNLDLNELQKIALSYSLSESTLIDYLTHINYLYDSSFSENLFAIECLCYQLLDYCESLHANYAADVVVHLIEPHLSSFIFILSINLKHQLATTPLIINFLGIYYCLYDSINNPMHSLFAEYLSLIEDYSIPTSYLQSIDKEISTLSKPFLTYLITFFDTNFTTEITHDPTNHYQLGISQTYLTLQNQPNVSLTKQSSDIPSKQSLLFQDPFYLILEATPLLLDFYSLRLLPTTTAYQLKTPRSNIENWLITHQSDVLSCLNTSLSKSVKILIQYAQDGHIDEFLNQRSHLVSLLFSLKSISYLQKLILAHTINLTSCLLELPNDSLMLSSPSLSVMDFNILTSKPLLFFFLTMYQFQLDQLPSFSLTEFDTLILQKLFTQFKHHSDHLVETDFVFLESFARILALAFKGLPNDTNITQQAVFSLLNTYYDYLDIIPSDSPFFKPFIYQLLPILNDLLEHGFIDSFHPFFNIIIDCHDQHPHPPDDLVACHTFLTDYQLLITCLSLNKPLNFNLFEAILQKPYIVNSLNYIFSTMPGMCLNFSLFLLTHLQDLSADDHDHGICFFLNHIFNQSLDLLQWKHSYFFFHLLKTFYTYSHDANHLDHMMGLSLKDHDKRIISALLLKSPQQAKQLILRLQDLSQSSHPLLKNLLISLLDHALETQLNDPLLTVKSIANNSLKECFIIKAEIDQNFTYTFQQLSHLVTTFSHHVIRPSTLQAFILKATAHLNVFPSSHSFISTLNFSSSSYICQLIHILRIIDGLHTVLSDVSHDTIQHLCRHICHIIARILLDPFIANNFDSSLLDYFFSTHQALLLDELKTIILDQNAISFSQVHNLLSLLQHSPKQLSYSRFSQWFIHLDILSYANDTDIPMILYECSLVNKTMAVDIIQAQKNPLHYLEIIIDNNTSLAFYLLYLLQQSVIETDQRLFSEASPLIKSHPFLSYFLHKNKTTHPIHDFLCLIYSETPPSPQTIAPIIKSLLPNQLDFFVAYLELLFLNQPDLFWILCQHDCFNLDDSIIELIQRSHSDTISSFSINPLSRWLSHPFFLTNIATIIDKNRYETMPPLLIHACILKNPSLISLFSDNDIILWILYCAKFNHLMLCFDQLKTRDLYSADCFYIMYFSSSQLISYEPTLFFDYLDYLDDMSLASFISTLDTTFHVSYHDFATFLLSSLTSLPQRNNYSELLIRCTPYLTKLHNNSAIQPLSDSATYIISYACLCYANELTLADICQLFKQCKFIPTLTLSTHLSTLSDAIFNPSNHHFFTDLALHYPAIFQQLFFIPSFANAIQQALYYNEVTSDSLLYNHIIKTIDSFNYTHLLQFLALYSQKHLTSQKQLLCYDLLDNFLPFSSDNVRNNFDELESHYKELVNTPIPRLAVKDPIITLIFQKLPQLRQHLNVTEQLYCFLSTNTQELAQHGIDFIHIKKQLELCSTDLPNRLLLLSYLHHPSDHKALHLFNNFIDNWTDKNSLYDTFILYLTDPHEHHLMYDYLLFMSRIVTRFSFKQFKIAPFKQLCAALHFLLTHAPDKTYLHQWITNCLIPNMKVSYFSYLAPIFSSHHIDQKIITSLANGFFTHQKTACYAPLFKSCFLQPSFCDIWETFLSCSKEHVILADLLVETSPLHMSIEIFLRNFIENHPKSFFQFCTIHHKYDIFIDVFFKKLYDHYFVNVVIDDAVMSVSSTNPMIAITRQALQHQETGFLFFLARCIEHYLIPNHKNITWFIQLLTSLYRVSFSTLSHDIDSSLRNTISKLFLNAGIILDSGELLQDLPSLSLDNLAALNPDITFTSAIEFAFVNLQQSAIACYQQRHHCINILIAESPSFFIRQTSAPSLLNQDLGITFFQDDPCYLDYLINLLFISGSNSLAMKEFFSFLTSNLALKTKFFNYIQLLPTDLLRHIITHPQLSIDQRHLILFSLLHDEKGRYHTLDHDTWESRVVHTLLTDLLSPWFTNFNPETNQTYIEILLFFFIHFPTSISSVCLEHYHPIFRQTGICIPKLFACKDQLEILFSTYNIIFLDLNNLIRIMKDLSQIGYSLFELVISFRSSVFFNPDLEQQWLSLYLETEITHSTGPAPAWFINLYKQLCIKQKLVYVADSFFESSLYHQALKRWLIAEGHLTTHNMLSLLTFDDFLHFYDPQTIYRILVDDISAMISPQGMTQDTIDRLAEPFFESVFFHLQAFSIKSTVHITECSLLMNMIPLPATHYEKSRLLDKLHRFEHALFSYNIVSLLNVSYIPFVMTLLQSETDTICLSKKDALLDSITISLDLTHSSFDSLSKKKKSSFHKFLIDNNILHHRSLNLLQLDLLKQDTAKRQEHYECFILLDKYLIAQKTLLESALTIIAQLGYILLYPFPIARIHFLDLFSSLHDHEWIYITYFLKQSLDNKTIDSLLQVFIGNKTALSKDSLKQHSLVLKNTPINTTELAPLFLDFQQKTANHIHNPHLPTSHSLFKDLMMSIIQTKHSS